MYATVAGPRVTGRRVVQHGRTLYLPSSRSQVNGEGLGDFLDTLKNFGKGALSVVSAGMYDLNKNRFYVPFSGGQVRNFMQGVTNFSTLGLVNTDKFFNSQTMRTIGNVGAGIEAATVAAIGVGAATGTMGFGASSSAVPGSVSGGGSSLTTSTGLLSNPSSLQSANLSYMTGIQPTTALPSSTGMFATAPITGSYAGIPTAANAFGTAGSALTSPSLLSQIGSGITDFLGKVPQYVSTGSQVMKAVQPIVGALTGSGGQVPQPGEMAAGNPSNAPVVIVAGPGAQVGLPTANGGFGFLPASYGDPSQGLVPGGGVMMGGGGGGAVSPESTGEGLVQDGGLMSHPAVPYVATAAVLGLAYFMIKK